MAYGKSLQQRIARLQELIAEQTAYNDKDLEEMVKDPAGNIEQIFRLLIENQISIQLTKTEESFKSLETIKDEL